MTLITFGESKMGEFFINPPDGSVWVKHGLSACEEVAFNAISPNSHEVRVFDDRTLVDTEIPADLVRSLLAKKCMVTTQQDAYNVVNFNDYRKQV